MMRAFVAVAMAMILIVGIVMYQGDSTTRVFSLSESKVSEENGVGMQAVDSAVVQRLDAKLQSKGSNTKMDMKGVHKAAVDIAEVISEGKRDEEKVKQVIHRSRTHGGENSAGVSLEKDLASLHKEAAAKKNARKSGKAGLQSGGGITAAIDASLDISHAGSKVKEARREALAIEQVLADSKKIVANADVIEKHSKKGNGSSIWTSFWNSKHSLVSRLAKQVGDDTKEGKH